MTTIKMKRGTAAAWVSANPTLQQGEPGFEVDTGRLKIGTGATPWTTLPYLSSGSGDVPATLEDHILDLTPHAPYDEGPSLTLLWENAKV